MISEPRQAEPPGFWKTVRLLLGVARRRAIGRQKRQQELLRNRARKKSLFQCSWLGFVVAILVTAIIHCGAAFIVYVAVSAGQRAAAEQHGKIVVSSWFLRAVEDTIAAVPLERTTHSAPDFSLHISKQERPLLVPSQKNRQLFANSEKFRQRLDGSRRNFQGLEGYYGTEARRIALQYGGTEKTIEKTLRESVRRHGSQDFVAANTVARGLVTLPRSGRLPALMGSIVLLWWCVMIVFQGEGLELDLQRRRHPVWEWLFSHPVSSGAIFMAEMLSPIAANPVYCAAPLFAGCLYGIVHGPQLGIAAAFVIGIPVAVAAACLGKALEIGVTLRLSPRSRGAMIGLMSWAGYASMMLLLLGAVSAAKVAGPAAKLLQPLTIFPWPWIGLFLGQWNGSFSFLVGMLTCWCAAGLTIAAAAGFSVWGARQGLAGNFGHADSTPLAVKNWGIRFGKEPLYRKEYLWFTRDRSAIVQTILIPLTIASFQVFNLRGVMKGAQGAWNYLCGAGILFGTYFLWILGPKSLASEGTALWIAQTWPRGMESLLKAKAWLWSLISSGIVGLVLLYAVYLFPPDAWKVLLVGIGWFFFGRSMAEKTVTLVRVPSSSGEPEKIPRTRQWAASLGMLTFSIGVVTQQWHIAIMGIVYSYITAAAMWENFRARLPFLYDPWSEELPPPPTLMHAMIAISILVEGGAVLTGIAVGVLGRENVATVQVVIYASCAILVSMGLARFLSDRGVAASDVWCWRPGTQHSKPWWCGNDTPSGRLIALMTGATGGVLLGLLAIGYLALLHHIPAAAEMIHKSQEQMAKIPGLRKSYLVMAVAFAPFAEEYLFRGLLFRALDREWGGWRAVLGSAAFFAIYHPPLSWLPVGLLGIANAFLFKKTGRLAPAVVLHMVYNAVVLG